MGKKNQYGKKRLRIIKDLEHGYSQSESARRNACTRQWVHIIKKQQDLQAEIIKERLNALKIYKGV